MSGSTVIFIVGFYVILSLLSDFTHAIELCRVNNNFFLGGGGGGVKGGVTTLPTSYAGCLEILGGTASWSHKGLSRSVMV
jgi:hypothetical protein